MRQQLLNHWRIKLKIRFNNTNSQSYAALKSGRVPIISHNVVILDGAVDSSKRHVTQINKVARDFSNVSISDFNFNTGEAVLTVNGEFNLKPSARLFINALLSNDGSEITAITGFSIAEVF